MMPQYLVSLSTNNTTDTATTVKVFDRDEPTAALVEVSEQHAAYLLMCGDRLCDVEMFGRTEGAEEGRAAGLEEAAKLLDATAALPEVHLASNNAALLRNEAAKMRALIPTPKEE